MPKLCEVLTWLSGLSERGINTSEDERFIRALRRIAMAADMMRDKLEELAKKLRGEE